MKPTLYLMMGYPGSGKTTASKVISNLTGAEHLWADHVRREEGEPTYSHEENTTLYDKLNTMTANLLAQGKSVIFDTNFNFYKDREHLRQIANDNHAKTVLVWVRTPLEVAKQRAVDEAHLHNTRVLGSMPETKFDRITHDLESPRNDEPYAELDGTKITDQYVSEKLSL